MSEYRCGTCGWTAKSPSISAVARAARDHAEGVCFKPGTRIALTGPMLDREAPEPYVNGLHQHHPTDTVGILLVGCPHCADTIQEAINTGGWKPA